MEVEVREEVVPPPDTTALLVNNTSSYPMADKWAEYGRMSICFKGNPLISVHGTVCKKVKTIFNKLSLPNFPIVATILNVVFLVNMAYKEPVVIVRAEEVLLVVLVLIIWVAAIALFFNRWGKIRMLEPYQPKFQQSHRPSCPLAPLSPPHITPQQRMSFSKYNVNCFADTYSGLPSPSTIRRPRLNSVFVGSSTMAFMNPPRRAKSAIDIQHLVLNEKRPLSLTGYSSMLPIINYRDRKPSITIAHCHSKHRPSLTAERPLLSHYQQFRNRRSSCAIDRIDRHRNFISFEQPKRKASTTIERPSCSFQGPTISFEIPNDTIEHPTVVIDKSDRPKISRSFEQPTADKAHLLPRMASSLDVNAINLGRRLSTTDENERNSPVIITLDDSEITANAPLLERLKSSDV